MSTFLDIDISEIESKNERGLYNSLPLRGGKKTASSLAPQATDEGVPLLTNLNHFYPVAERRQGNKLPPPHKSRWTGFGSEQPEFATRNTATPKFAQRKNRTQNPIGLKF